MIQLQLLAHPGSRAQRQGRFPLFDEPAFNPKGLQPAVAGTLLSAPEPRALDWASSLGGCTVAEALADQHMGVWQGCALEELAPAQLQRWLQEPGFAPPGGESQLALLGRVGTWLSTLSPGRYSAISHPAVLRAAACFALGLPAGALQRLDIGPGAGLCLSFNGAWRVGL